MSQTIDSRAWDERDVAARELERRLGLRAERDVPLASHTTMRVGGPADLLVAVKDRFALRGIVRYTSARVIEVIGRVADKWTMMVLDLLAEEGEMRFTQIGRKVEGISQKMLTQTLRDLEASGLLSRHVQSAIPPAVEYRLTDLGRRFVEPVELLYAWGRDNADALDALLPRATSRRA